MAKASPIRLSPSLLSAAERTGLIQKRSVPMQIEFWAELGKMVERFIKAEDAYAILQGFKQLRVEPVASKAVDPDDVFASLEASRKSGNLKEKVTTAAIYYEASLKTPGCLDQVESKTGVRQTGRFINGEFTPN